ncbi:MAG: hypothetical protein RLN99_14580 [Kiloniellaceae bacterium]
MSRNAKAYCAAAAVLIAFPLLLSLWSGSVALLAILIIGMGAYALAVCFLAVAFWCRYRNGTWPVELPEEPRDPQYQSWEEAR